jgi:hydrogenase maturation protease
MKTLIVGLGNPILSDDAVGWRVAQEVHKRLEDQGRTDLEVDWVSLGGISLMERLVGFDRAMIIDAIQSRGGKPGAIYQLGLDDLPTFNANAIHDASLKVALDMGRKLGASLPDTIVVFAIECIELWEFGEQLSPPVEAAVLPAAQMVLEHIME